MKYALIFLILTGVVMFGSKALAQSDSVRTEYRTEDEAVSRSEIQRLMRYITRADVEEKTLLKIGGLPNGSPFSRNAQSASFGLNTELAVERKLTPSFSFLLGLDNQFSMAFYQRLAPVSGSTTPDWRTDRISQLTVLAKAAARYYYSMHRRMEAGKSANNFSGTYMAFQVRRPVRYYNDNRQYNVTSGETRHFSQNYSLRELNQASFALQWGIQQRLGHRGYVDLNAGPELTINDRYSATDVYNNLRYGATLSPYTWQFRISAIIGLGW